MMNSIDLQVLKETLNFLEENCVGPQKAQFLYKALSNRFNSITSFSYSYFVSLFNNMEIITKDLVKKQIENAETIEIENVNTEYNNNDYTKQSQENTENKTYSKKKIVEQTNEVLDNSDEQYYYCTKTIRVQKIKVLETLLELFNNNGSEREDFKLCYDYLRQKFNINSFNMANLKILLRTEKIVLKSVVEQLYLNMPNAKKKIEVLDIKKLFIDNNDTIRKVIETLGLEFVIDLIKNGLHRSINLLSAIKDIDNEFETKLELENPENDQLFNESDKKTILGFLSLFTEEELLKNLNSKETMTEFIDMYLEDEKKRIKTESFCEELHNMFANINIDNRVAKNKYILPFEIVPFFSQQNINYLSDLINIEPSKLAPLENHKELICNFMRVLRQSIPAYINEKFKLLLQRVNASNVPNSMWEKYVEALCYREQGLTLEETSKNFDTSRERIRQIESRYVLLFNDFYNSQNGTITRLIRSFAKNECYLTKDDIYGIISFYPNLFIYLLKQIEVNDLTYIDELEVFYFIDEVDWYKELLMAYENLPDIVNEEQLLSAIEKVWEKLKKLDVDIPYEFCKKVIEQDFKQNGNFYSKSKISQLTKYKRVMEKSFPNGIKINDKNCISLFRKTYKELFDDNIIPNNDRALYARLTAACYQIDKGTYALKKDNYISNELSEKIYNYIINSDKDYFLATNLFYIFEDELKEEGILNRYHFQGVMRELFDDKLFFSRDYISKTKERNTIGTAIYEYIKQSKRIVSLDEIFKEFPGIPLAMINNAINTDDILKLSGSYLHIDNIDITENDIKHFKELIEDSLKDNEISHSYTLFDKMQENNDYLLSKFNIDTQFKLFSYIQCFLQGEFEFQRPYFAKKGQKIGYQRERIINFIKDNYEVSFEDIKEEFGGIPDSVIYNAIHDEKILNLKQVFGHVDNFNFQDEDIKLINNYLNIFCQDGKIHSSYELMMLLDMKEKDFIEKYNIDSQFKLFSIVEYLCKDNFHFQRPYFAKKGIAIPSRIDRVTEFLREHNEIKISDLFDYVYKNQLTIPSITDYINDLKDEYVFKDKDTIIAIEKSNLTVYNTQIAEQVLLQAMGTDDFIVSSKFNSYNFLPTEVKWTDWLLYSAINKFGKKLKVITSFSQMRRANPIFIKADIQVNNVDELKKYLKETTQLDDISFIKYLKAKDLLD